MAYFSDIKEYTFSSDVYLKELGKEKVKKCLKRGGFKFNCPIYKFKNELGHIIFVQYANAHSYIPTTLDYEISYDPIMQAFANIVTNKDYNKVTKEKEPFEFYTQLNEPTNNPIEDVLNWTS